MFVRVCNIVTPPAPATPLLLHIYPPQFRVKIFPVSNRKLGHFAEMGPRICKMIVFVSDSRKSLLMAALLPPHFPVPRGGWGGGGYQLLGSFREVEATFSPIILVLL